MKHTKGPWSVSEKTIRSMGGEVTWIEPIFVNQNDDCLMTIPDAERIVSCINALEGVESPEPLMQSYREMLHIKDLQRVQDNDYSEALDEIARIKAELRLKILVIEQLQRAQKASDEIKATEIRDLKIKDETSQEVIQGFHQSHARQFNEINALRNALKKAEELLK